MRPRRFRLPWRSVARLRAEVDEEIAFHLEMRAAALEAEGVPPGEARARAQREFGDVEAARRALGAADRRGERRLRLRLGLASVGSDARIALRSLARAPGFTALAALTLALGIGASTAMFAAVDAVVLRPLPYAAPERLVSVWEGMTRGEYALARERSRTLEALELYQPSVGFAVAGPEGARRVTGALVTPGLFRALGVRPVAGRALVPGEEAPGAEAVVVLGERLWRQLHGEGRDPVGADLVIDGRPHRVVGVMPASFRFPAADAELWVPLPLDAADPASLWGSWGGHVVGRLRQGITPGEAQRELRTLSREMSEANPLWTPPADYRADARVVPLRSAVAGDAAGLMLLLLGAVGLLLLIACANVANLLLVRGVARAREVAVRAALGASRGRVVRQMLVESVVLGCLGGAAGCVLAVGGVAALRRLLPPETPRLAEMAVDGRVLAVAVTLSLLTGLLFGAAPALRAGRRDPAVALRSGGRAGVGRERRRLAGALVATQIALAVVLAAGAGLLLRTLDALSRVDPGFRAEQVVTARLDLATDAYTDAPAQLTAAERVVRAVRALPGVQEAAVATHLPFGGQPGGFAIFIEGVTDDPNVLPVLDHRAVEPAFFSTLGIPLLRGRLLSAADRADAPLVAVVDRETADRFWPGADPLGRRVRYPWRGAPWITVVGVVESVRNGGLAGERVPALYVPLAQRPARQLSLVVRTTLDPEALARSLVAAVQRMDPLVPVSRVRPMTALVAESVARPRLAARLLGAFSAAALLLGAVGVYGVTSYAVSRDSRDLALRLALGARREEVRRFVLRRTAALTLAGVAAGVGAALLATRALRSLLYQVAPGDLPSLLGAALLLTAAALLAAWIPARRAARVNPVDALRAD